jgi:hypothetical protein
MGDERRLIALDKTFAELDAMAEEDFGTKNTSNKVGF